jgi:hypothetical protein
MTNKILWSEVCQDIAGLWECRPILEMDVDSKSPKLDSAFQICNWNDAFSRLRNGRMSRLLSLRE